MALLRTRDGQCGRDSNGEWTRRTLNGPGDGGYYGREMDNADVIVTSAPYALGRQEEVVVIHTDSMSALQVLRQPRTPMDNVQLTTPHPGGPIQGLAAQGRRVRFNWVPSHVGLRGNEAAREATRHPAVALNVLPSIHGAKVLARRAAVCAAGQQYRQLVQTSRQAAWHKQATNHNEQLRPAQQLSRPEVVLHRLRLGYRTLEELRDGFEERPCEHCPYMAPRPLTHYLLSCPATARLRQRVGPLEDAAVLVLRQVQKNLPSCWSQNNLSVCIANALSYIMIFIF
ncbi:hypothetical protein GWK47_049939 [Chionoecetes opilio]|uniref:RNase H type-1 domain-containing protein n=1 Tax=Chionoecetes opilio TaxID=41210 RepID=A0A8J4Y259_CHIOP|nr:hypothetical protein GWK47_049939 [Chionoecetes opilio]